MSQETSHTRTVSSALAGVANQMASGRRDDADKSSEERDGLRDEVGAAVGPRALELVRDPAVGGPGEPIVGERGPCAVAGETFERLAIVIGDHDTCVQREAPGPRAEAVGAAHDVGGGRGAPGGDGLGLNLREQGGCATYRSRRRACCPPCVTRARPDSRSGDHGQCALHPRDRRERVVDRRVAGPRLADRWLFTACRESAGKFVSPRSRHRS